MLSLTAASPHGFSPIYTHKEETAYRSLSKAKLLFFSVLIA